MTLPVLISVPHGGLITPQELTSSVALSHREIFEDIDPFTREIYHVEKHVQKWIDANIARPFVDLNRAPDDWPEKNPDGVIKQSTCYERNVYKKEHEPQQLLRNQLIEKYYTPYHRKIEDYLHNDNLVLALDCHSMAAQAPPISPDRGKKRPLICLGNRNGDSCSYSIMEKLGNCLRQAFGLTKKELSYNVPFSGGFITRNYGMNPIPWIQVEMNRSLYLQAPWFDQETLNIDHSRIQYLNNCFLHALEKFFEKKNGLNKATGESLDESCPHIQ